jgi:hypothetical protein
MRLLGQIKTRIYKLLEQYSKNGVYLSPADASLADIALRINTVVDMTLRRISVSAGVLSEKRLRFAADESGNARISAPEDLAAVTAVISPAGDETSAKFYVNEGDLCFEGLGAGEYTLVYAHYPESLEEAADSHPIPLDDYLCDALAAGAAAELAEKDDPETGTKLKRLYDEIMLNRFNVDKLSCPPYQRVYGTVYKRRVKPWHS